MVFLPPTTSPSPISEPIFRVNPLTQSVNLARQQSRQATILECFSELTDPRLNRKKRHLLEDIVVLAICGILGGADDWVGIEAFGREKYHWFKQHRCSGFFLAVNFPVIAFRSTSQGRDSMNTINVWIVGSLISKPEFSPLIIKLCYFQNA